MVIFRKVSDVTGHAELNGTYKDLYASKGGMVGRTFSVDGASAAVQTSDGHSSIKAGLEYNKSIMSATLPTLPSYGDAKLHSLDFRLKVEDVLTGSVLTTAPEIALFKIRNNIPDYGASGESRKLVHSSLGKPAGHLTAISSTGNGFLSDEEDFSGAINAYEYANQAVYIPQPRGLLVGKRPYLSRQDGWDYGLKEMVVGATKINASGTIDDYSVDHTEYRDDVEGKQCVIKMVAGTDKPRFWVTTKNSGSSDPVYFSHDEIGNIINFGDKTVLDADESYNNQVTPDNSFFSVVKQDRELMLEPESSDPILIGAGVSRFNSKNSFGSTGQSMEMFCHWAGDNRIDSSGAIGTSGSATENIQKLKGLYRPVTSPGGNFHTAQETFASYGTVPFPTKIFPSAIRDLGGGTHNTMDPYRSTIEIDFNLDEIDAAVKYDAASGADGKISVVKRAFVVTMGYYKPSVSDTLTSYVSKHCPLDAYTEGDELDHIAGLPFFGWSFINVQESNEGMLTNGIKVIPSHVWKVDKTAVGDTKGISKGYDLYVDEDRSKMFDADDTSADNTGHYGGDSDGPAKYNGGINYWDPTASVPDKSWLTLKMMFTPYWGSSYEPIEWGLYNAGDHSPVVWDQYSNHLTGTAYGSNAIKGNTDKNHSVDANTDPATFPIRPEDFNFSNSYKKFSAKKCKFHFPAEYLPHFGVAAMDTDGMDFWQNDSDYLGDDDLEPASPDAVWPRYLTIWLTNYATNASVSNSDVFLEQFGGEQTITVDGTDEVLRRATQSRTYVGGIRLKDFNYQHSNATVSDTVVSNTSRLNIGGGTVNMYGSDDTLYPKQQFPGYSILSFGVDDRTSFDEDDVTKERMILLNDYSGNLASNIAPYKIHGSITTDFHNALPANEEAESYFGSQFTEIHLDGDTDGDDCFTIEPGITQDSGKVDLTGDNLCENFTQKGGIRIDDLESSAKRTTSTANEPTLSLREHHGCAAKILKVVNALEGIYRVDTTEIFKGGENDTYITYLYGAGYTSLSSSPSTDTAAGKNANAYNNVVKLVQILDDRHVKLKWNGLTSVTDDSMVTDERMPYLWISPYKNWLYFSIAAFEYDSDEGVRPLSPRSYSSAVLLTEQIASETALAHPYGTVGATHNEYLYQDTPSISGAYENSWSHSMSDKTSIIDNQDFGFGEWTEEDNMGGYMASKIAKPNTTLKFNMPNVVDVSDLEPGDIFNFMLAPKTEDSLFEVVYKNPEFAHTAQGPVLYSNFEDELPQAPILSVAPSKDNEAFPEFKIQNSASDLWYQLLIVDKQPINSQYHGGILHLPLNESGQHGVHPSTVPKNLLFNNNNDTDTTSNTAHMSDNSGVLHDAEGLAGNCVRLDGSAGVSYNPSNNTFSDITSEWSAIAHVVPDITTSDTTVDVILNGTAPFNIKFLQASKTITAEFFSSTGSDAGTASLTLTSPAVQIDGDTPICVIATFDRYLKAGNCKLFIDGVLVDQSGLATSTAMASASNATNANWCSADNASISTSAFRVGTASGDGFKGRVEEVVIYNKTIYPLPSNADKFLLSKALTDIENGSPVGYTARLFTKDYHNIRGNTKDEVACSSQVSWRKAGFRLHD